jgi:hypothetical protein
MNRVGLLLASVCAATTCLLAGCPLGCGGYSGGGDTVYARGSDQLVLCENGGFVATSNGQTIEGKLETDTSAETIGIEGDDNATVFTLDGTSGDATVDTDGLGSGEWDYVTENQVGLDHANTLCTDLTTRSWWTAS